MGGGAATPYSCLVIDERSRGVALYSLTAAVLLAGGVWWFSADPTPDVTSEVAAWREAVEAALPEEASSAGLAETVVLGENARTERSSSVDGGAYTLSMVCAGPGGQVRVRLSTTGTDSGRAVPCTADPEVDQIRVALADELSMRLSTESDVGGVVFRWRLNRAQGF